MSTIGIALLVFAWSRIVDADTPATSARDTSSGSSTTEDAERWVASVAENGLGHVSTKSLGSDREDVSTYVTLGQLSSRGREALLSAIQSEIDEVEASLDTRLSAQPAEGDAGLGAYERDLKKIARLELLRARAELVRDGTYITIPLSGITAESVPPEPVGVVSATYGAFEVENGELAQVMLWVTKDKREAMRSVEQALRDVLAARREQWVADFNAAPEDVRRHWFSRYRTLSDLQAQGVSQMSNAEVSEWFALRQTVRHFSLELSEQTWTVR